MDTDTSFLAAAAAIAAAVLLCGCVGVSVLVNCDGRSLAPPSEGDDDI